MAAAAFLANLIFRGQDGWNQSYPCTVSDVNAAFYIFQDGNNLLNLPSNHGNIALSDVQLSASGTDTRTANIFANQRNTGEAVQNAANLAFFSF